MVSHDTEQPERNKLLIATESAGTLDSFMAEEQQ